MLGQKESRLDEAAAWIERSRALQREKELAEKRAKLLEEMDQEFGLSPVMEEEIQRRRWERYSARDLQGLTVEQEPASMAEGQSVVQSLRDRGVLQGGEHVLEQVALAAAVRAHEKPELRRPNYGPYGEQEPGPGPQAPRPSFRLRPERPDPRGGGNIVFDATSEFCRTLGEIPTYGLAGNREEQDGLMALERAGSPAELPDSEGKENVGWSSVTLAEERQQQHCSASSTTILDREPIVNRGLAAALLLCQTKGLLETTGQKVARVKAPNKSLPSAVYCIEDKMAIHDKCSCREEFPMLSPVMSPMCPHVPRDIHDKCSRREEFRAFKQDFKEKDGYRAHVKIEYVDETGRKLTPKEAFQQLSHRFNGKGSGKMKTERRMKKLDEEVLLEKMSSSDTPLGTVALLQEKQRTQKMPYIVLSGSSKSMNTNTITK